MKPPFRRPAAGGTAEFYVRQLENVVLVQRNGDVQMIVCATADNLTSEQRKAFIRLGAEGFMVGDSKPPGGFDGRETE